MQVDATSSGSAQGILTGGNQKLGKDEFLKLLTAQLQSQDPLNPMEDTAFVAQLAQFSSLEQLIDLNSGMASISLAQDRVAATQAASLIGKEILAIGDGFEMAEGESTDLSFYLGGEAKEVTIEVYDERGVHRNTITLSDRAAGKNVYTFPGRDSDGNPLPAGNYTFEVTAKDVDGNVVGVTTATRGLVSGVEFNGGLIGLRVGDRTVSLADLIEVTAPSGGQG